MAYRAILIEQINKTLQGEFYSVITFIKKKMGQKLCYGFSLESLQLVRGSFKKFPDCFHY